MWANHDWLDIFPVGRVGGGGKIFNGGVYRMDYLEAVRDVLVRSWSNVAATSNGGPATLGIFDSQGRSVIRAESKASGVLRIPRSGLRTGIYWMRVEAAMKTVQRKLFVF